MRDEKVSQHYVPRLHLRRFSTSPDSDTVNCFDKQNENSFTTSVDGTAVEDFFYDGKRELEPEMENFLENLESRVGGLYTRIVETESLDCLSQKEKVTFALFLGVQIVRTRGERSSIRGIVESIEEKIPRENMAEEFREELDEAKKEESLREVQNNLIKDGATDFADMLMELNWHLFVNDTDLPYYTSDHPVVKHNELDFGPYGNQGLMSPGVQIYFPLTPWLLLSIVEPSIYPGRPEVSNTKRENVVFQRDLQVTRSNRFVYSCREDFDQVEKRLRDSPEVAKPLSERMNVE